MREFDVRCMAKVKEFSVTQIKALRLREGVSQPIFALYYRFNSKAMGAG